MMEKDQEANNPLARKLNKILENKLDSDKETLEALKALSTFFPENTLRARRNLRSDIEKRSLLVNEEFVQAFKNVKEVLDDLYTSITEMNQCCTDMRNRLQTTKSHTHDLISQTTKLQAEGNKIQMKQEVVQAFLSTFQLKQEEVIILRGTREGGLNEDFFKVLAKVKKLHSDCKILLRSNQQTAGLEIMESMALHQEAAYERLYRWTQSECRLLIVESPDINPLLCQAMESLQDRSVLFKYSIDEYANARRAAIVRGFIDALTRGGPGGMPRPIELHSHDPLRYVGDMLAWLHQTIASEKEMIEGVLRKCSKENLEEEIQQALSHITEGLCRPLKVRVEQVTVSEPGAVILFCLSSLLKFYHQTINQVVTVESQLLNVLKELQDLSKKMFYNSMTCHCNQLLEQIELPPADLSPPESLTQSLTLLKEILTCQDASLVSIDDRQKDVPQILTTMLEPLLQMCHMSASKLAPVDMAVYLTNCLHLTHTSLTVFEFSDQQLEMLQAQMEAHLDTLVSEQTSQIVGQLGFGTVYKTLQAYQPKQGPLSTIPGCDALAIQSANKKLDAFLSSPDSLTIPQCNLLLSVVLRQDLRSRTVELLCSVYKQIYNAIHDPSNAYPEPDSLFPRSPDQISTLLK